MTKRNATTPLASAQEALLDAPDLLREIVRSALRDILEAEMTEHVGAERHERTDGRTGQRNGHKPRMLTTRVGAMTLMVPQDRDGTFSTKLFARYQRTEKAFVLALMEMYVVGVSTRKVARVTEELCGTTFSKSTVSALCGRLDAELSAWRTRSLSDHTWPYLFVDARYEKVRRSGRVVSQGVLIAYGVRDDGFREIVAVSCEDTESEATYHELFADLKARGLSGVMLVTSDAHPGLKAAIARHFQGASWQRCQVHFSRDQIKKVACKHRKRLTADLKEIWAATTTSAALDTASRVADSWRNGHPKIAEAIDEQCEECLTVLHFPAGHRLFLRTNNALERFNQEIKRRTRVVRIFPNEGSCLRLVSALCVETSEEWMTNRRFLDMDALREMLDAEREEECRLTAVS
ncbi:MAG: IS256 family transposase [Coriobacteriia bacterium]|nr:IS256 family transposase [Coriobacteriia bacterium]